MPERKPVSVPGCRDTIHHARIRNDFMLVLKVVYFMRDVSAEQTDHFDRWMERKNEDRTFESPMEES